MGGQWSPVAIYYRIFEFGFVKLIVNYFKHTNDVGQGIAPAVIQGFV